MLKLCSVVGRAMLTPEEIEQLRRDAVRLHGRRRAHARHFLFVGGPLDGLTLSMRPDADQAAATGLAKLTRRGCYQALYRGRPDRPGELHFLEVVPPHATGRPNSGTA